MTNRLGTAALSAALIVAAVACGSDGVDVIDAAKVEADIVAGLEDEGLEGVEAECPDDRPAKADDTFTCTASVHGDEHRVTVTQADAEGTVDWELDGLIVTRSVVAETITAEATDLGYDLFIDCEPDDGEYAVFVAQDGDAFYCGAAELATNDAIGIEVIIDSSTETGFTWETVGEVIPGNGGSGGSEGPSATPAGMVVGDPEDLCLWIDDLPEGYSEELQRATDTSTFMKPITYVQPDWVTEFKADHVEAHGHVYTSTQPPGTQAATCAVTIFDTAEIDEYYEWYAGEAADRSKPPMEFVHADPDATGAPHLYSQQGTYGTTHVMYIRYRNATASISVKGRGATLLDDLSVLAAVVYDRLEAAAS